MKSKICEVHSKDLLKTISHSLNFERLNYSDPNKNQQNALFKKFLRSKKIKVGFISPWFIQQNILEFKPNLNRQLWLVKDLSYQQ